MIPFSLQNKIVPLGGSAHPPILSVFAIQCYLLLSSSVIVNSVCCFLSPYLKFPLSLRTTYRYTHTRRKGSPLDIPKSLGHIRLPTLDKRRSRVMRKFGTKTLDGIYEERRDYIVLVTAAWLGSEDRKVKPDEHSD